MVQLFLTIAKFISKLFDPGDLYRGNYDIRNIWRFVYVHYDYLSGAVTKFNIYHVFHFNFLNIQTCCSKKYTMCEMLIYIIN
jgi:hypothetical protein